MKKQHKAEDERAKYKKVHIIIFFSQFLCCFPRSLTFWFSSNISQFRPTISPQNRQHPRGKLFSFIVYVFRECLKNYCATAKKREKIQLKLVGGVGEASSGSC